MYNDEMIYKHSREGSIMDHKIPKGDSYVHIRNMSCECMPEADPDDIRSIIHNYYGPLEKTEFKPQ